MRDFRSEKMETADGKGIARARRLAEGRRFGRRSRTLWNRQLRRITASQVSDLVGFWTMWHLHGGFEGLEELGMSRSTIFARVRRFRTLFGKHPDEYQLPGVVVDVEAYWSAVASERGE